MICVFFFHIMVMFPIFFFQHVSQLEGLGAFLPYSHSKFMKPQQLVGTLRTF